MEFLFVGFPSIDQIKKINTSDRIISCTDINKIDNYINEQRRIIFVNSSSDSTIDKTKLNNFVKSVKKTFSTKIIMITDETEKQNSSFGILKLYKSPSESNEKVCIDFGKKVRSALDSIVGESSHIKEVRRKIFDTIFSDPHVLIFGETGTGKNLLASSIHKISLRKGPMISLNLTTLPESLLESELFGHAKGAYTGASVTREGLIGQAHTGHFFLDEIGELPIEIQAKLLNVIEDGKYYMVGSSNAKEIDVKFISATNRDKNFLRKDLLFRLSEETIELLPLRNRKEDIPYLVDFFLKQLDYDITFNDMPEEVRSKLLSYNYPGNIRELQNIIKRYLSGGILDLSADMSFHFNTPTINANEYKFIDNSILEIVELSIKNRTIMPLLEFKDKISSKFEKEYVSQVLRNFKWDKQLVANQLGISYRYLNKLIKKYSLDRRTVNNKEKNDQ
ncbi:sigma 54-interacting transcriptional regulator [Athalassotoga saccharophila]|uniref:sigma 54-interacting transcriptional regulator n=1 Tax=Athalassotoga saccharophila TaxID=1441386 RepID=UPI00137A11EE|nr:sigma 54-interacting transcriptional regulator [Athalassotoga saccharophila]BBJ28977.1 regulatory protein AtoC [Athalassotoga saccharophila]